MEEAREGQGEEEVVVRELTRASIELWGGVGRLNDARVDGKRNEGAGET